VPQEYTLKLLNNLDIAFMKTLITLVVSLCMLTWVSVASAEKRILIQQGEIEAPQADVWALFATSEGAQQWMAPQIKIDLRVGGEIRSSYHPESNLDDEHTIINRILMYIPNRMLVLQNVQAPTGFPHAELFQQAWSIITLQAVNDNQTHVRIAGVYGTGPQWDELYAFFDQGNHQLLAVLQEVAAKRAVDQPAADQQEAKPTRDLLYETTVKSDLATVWRAWTTAEGLCEFFSMQAEVELRIGGKYELAFAPDAPAGQRGTETCRILAYEPQRMLSMSWNAPPHLPFARQHHTWVVVEFESVDDEHVRVQLTQFGFDALIEAHPEHAREFEQTRAYFQRAWPHVLDAMRTTLEH